MVLAIFLISIARGEKQCCGSRAWRSRTEGIIDMCLSGSLTTFGEMTDGRVTLELRRKTKDPKSRQIGR